MRKMERLSKPEYWLLLLAIIGILFGTLATYGKGIAPGFPGFSWLPDSPGASLSPVRVRPPVTTPGDEASWRIEDEENTVEVFESAKRGVVMVITSRGRPASGNPVISRKGNGSGFFIDYEGHVVTNYHVVEDAAAIEVQTFSGRLYKAVVVGSDRLTDLAVLEVQAIPQEEVFPIPLADYREVRVGQKAIVLGSPLATGSSMGLDRSPTVTTGIISAKDRSMPIESLSRPNVTDYTIENLIQTDAAVNPGNSGGPLLNSRGEVVGVVTAIMDAASGIGFAIPSQVVAGVVPDILRAGEVTRPYMGIRFQQLDLLAKDMDAAAFAQLGLGVSKGALLIEVEESSSAAKAGLKGSTRQVTVGGQEYSVGGDIITGLDGVEIVGSNLSGEILKHKPGDKVKLEVLRDGEKMTVEVTLGSR